MAVTRRRVDQSAGRSDGEVDGAGVARALDGLDDRGDGTRQPCRRRIERCGAHDARGLAEHDVAGRQVAGLRQRARPQDGGSVERRVGGRRGHAERAPVDGHGREGSLRGEEHRPAVRQDLRPARALEAPDAPGLAASRLDDVQPRPPQREHDAVVAPPARAEASRLHGADAERRSAGGGHLLQRATRKVADPLAVGREERVRRSHRSSERLRLEAAELPDPELGAAVLLGDVGEPAAVRRERQGIGGIAGGQLLAARQHDRGAEGRGPARLEGADTAPCQGECYAREQQREREHQLVAAPQPWESRAGLERVPAGVGRIVHLRERVADVAQAAARVLLEASAQQSAQPLRSRRGSTCHRGSADRIAASVSVVVCPSKGRRPASISNSRQPNAQTSVRLSTGRPRACSGDM